MQLSGNREGHLTACHFPEEPTIEGRAEDVVMDPGLRAMERSGDEGIGKD